MFLRKPVSLLLIACFGVTAVCPRQSYAQEPLVLPQAGAMVETSLPFNPLMIKGVTVNPKNPLQFDFVLAQGDSTSPEAQGAAGDFLKKESNRLIKYFLACLAIPENDLWVNLSPYEKDKMIPESLGQTELGRDLLAQDYILKQLTASLIYPEKDLGKAFWDRVYKKAKEQYGTTEIPVNTFNKVWILADTAKVFEKGNTAYVINAHLKVMLDEDYTAQSKNVTSGWREGGDPHHAQSQTSTMGTPQRQDPLAAKLGSEVIREIVLPEIEREVNTGKNFSTIRQIFHAFILASWYKKNLKQSLLNQAYVNKKKVNGLQPTRGHHEMVSPSSMPSEVALNTKAPEGTELTPNDIYQQYLKAYKKGVFNYIKEEPTSNQPRKYFSGGTVFKANDIQSIVDPTQLSDADRVQIGQANFIVKTNLISDTAMLSDKQWHEKIRTGLKQLPTVLLIEDSEVMIKALVQDIKAYQFKVLVGRSYEEGMKLYQQHKATIGLVITDNSMPELAGERGTQDLGERVRREIHQDNQNMSVIFQSGNFEKNSVDDLGLIWKKDEFYDNWKKLMSDVAMTSNQGLSAVDIFDQMLLVFTDIRQSVTKGEQYFSGIYHQLFENALPITEQLITIEDYQTAPLPIINDLKAELETFRQSFAEWANSEAIPAKKEKAAATLKKIERYGLFEKEDMMELNYIVKTIIKQQSDRSPVLKALGVSFEQFKIWDEVERLKAFNQLLTFREFYKNVKENELPSDIQILLGRMPRDNADFIKINRAVLRILYPQSIYSINKFIVEGYDEKVAQAMQEAVTKIDTLMPILLKRIDSFQTKTKDTAMLSSNNGVSDRLRKKLINYPNYIEQLENLWIEASVGLTIETSDPHQQGTSHQNKFQQWVEKSNTLINDIRQQANINVLINRNIGFYVQGNGDTAKVVTQLENVKADIAEITMLWNKIIFMLGSKPIDAPWMDAVGVSLIQSAVDVNSLLEPTADLNSAQIEHVRQMLLKFKTDINIFLSKDKEEYDQRLIRLQQYARKIKESDAAKTLILARQVADWVEAGGFTPQADRSLQDMNKMASDHMARIEKSFDEIKSLNDLAMTVTGNALREETRELTQEVNNKRINIRWVGGDIELTGNGKMSVVIEKSPLGNFTLRDKDEKHVRHPIDKNFIIGDEKAPMVVGEIDGDFIKLVNNRLPVLTVKYQTQDAAMASNKKDKIPDYGVGIHFQDAMKKVKDASSSNQARYILEQERQRAQQNLRKNRDSGKPHLKHFYRGREEVARAHLKAVEDEIERLDDQAMTSIPYEAIIAKEQSHQFDYVGGIVKIFRFDENEPILSISSNAQGMFLRDYQGDVSLVDNKDYERWGITVRKEGKRIIVTNINNDIRLRILHDSLQPAYIEDYRRIGEAIKDLQFAHDSDIWVPLTNFIIESFNEVGVGLGLIQRDNYVSNEVYQEVETGLNFLMGLNNYLYHGGFTYQQRKDSLQQWAEKNIGGSKVKFLNTWIAFILNGGYSQTVDQRLIDFKQKIEWHGKHIIDELTALRKSQTGDKAMVIHYDQIKRLRELIELMNDIAKHFRDSSDQYQRDSMMINFEGYRREAGNLVAQWYSHEIDEQLYEQLFKATALKNASPVNFNANLLIDPWFKVALNSGNIINKTDIIGRNQESRVSVIGGQIVIEAGTDVKIVVEQDLTNLDTKFKYKYNNNQGIIDQFNGLKVYRPDGNFVVDIQYDSNQKEMVIKTGEIAKTLQVSYFVMPDKAMATPVVKGGIDLKQSDLTMEVTKDASSTPDSDTAFQLDPQVVAQLQSGDFNGLIPVIVSVMPLNGAQYLLN